MLSEVNIPWCVINYYIFEWKNTKFRDFSGHSYISSRKELFCMVGSMFCHGLTSDYSVAQWYCGIFPGRKSHGYFRILLIISNFVSSLASDLSGCRYAGVVSDVFPRCYALEVTNKVRIFSLYMNMNLVVGATARRSVLRAAEQVMRQNCKYSGIKLAALFGAWYQSHNYVTYYM